MVYGEDYDSTDNLEGLPAKEDFRFLSESDFISSSDDDRPTGNDAHNSSELKKYDQLNPKTKLIKNILQLKKPKRKSIWKKGNVSLRVDDSLNISCNLTHSETVTMNKSKRKREGTSSEDEANHQVKKIKNKRSEDSFIYKKVHRKEQVHDLSSSDREDFDHSSKKQKKLKSKSVSYRDPDNLSTYEEQNATSSTSESENPKFKSGNKNKLSEITNGHSFKSDNISKEQTDVDVLPNSQNSESDNELSDQSEQELKSDRHDVSDSDSDSNSVKNHQKEGKNIVNKKSDKNSHSSNLVSNQALEETYREHYFTDEDKEEISKYSSLLSEEVLENNDIWIMQCPSNVNCSSLVNECLNLDGSSSLDDGERTYEAHSYRSSQKRFATLAIPNYRNKLSLCRIPIAGNIILEETIKFKNYPKHNIPDSPKCVELPKNLRVRHPLLGTNYENQPKTVTKKGRTSKKKKKHTSHDTDEGTSDVLMKSPISNEPIKKKKKKKSRSSEDLTFCSYTEEDHLEGTVEISNTKKKKKKKYHNDDSS